MAKVEIGGLQIGEGAPKICVPLVGQDTGEMLAQAKRAASLPCDMVELRIDYYKQVFENSKVLKLLRQLKEILSCPILFTFRTAKEGGEQAITIKQYRHLYESVIKQGLIDLIDLELFLGEEVVRDLCRQAKDKGIKIIISNHDFEKTPAKEEIIKRLIKMQTLGADIPKIAVMPETKQDVLTLLEATLYMQKNHNQTPVVGISMGDLGVLSRLCGGWSGSAITFGVAEKASAPGQLSVEQLKQVFDVFYK